MHKRFLAWLVLAIVFACGSLSAQAQPEENEGVAEAIFITPKAGQGQALEAAIREYHLWIGDKPGHFRYTWYQVETGPEAGSYLARSGGHDWADFDQQFDWQEEAAARFMADVFPLVDHIERRLTVEMPEFSHWPEDMSEYTLFQVERWYVKPGQYGKFRAGLEKIHKALTAGGFNQYYGFNDTVTGAKGNEIALVLAHRNYADMAEGEPSFYDVVSKAVGGPEAFEALMAEFGSSYHVGETFLVRVLPEASDYGDEE